ncbi:MAG: chemotaxis protein CheX [Actinomycetes bacterium]
MELLTSDIEEIVSSVWGAMFDQSLAVFAGGRWTQGEIVRSHETIHGEATVTVELDVPVSLATELTVALLADDAPPGQAGVLDAIGELCNIVAGNFKVLMGGAGQLSQPSGVFATSDDQTPALTAPGLVALFTCAGRVFAVRVLQSPFELGEPL